jgi:hypothetical protein
VLISLNYDIMASFPFDSHPEFPKSDPASAVLWCQVATHMLACLIERQKNTLYTSKIEVGSNQRWLSANHDIMTSFPIDSCLELPKSDPALAA